MFTGLIEEVGRVAQVHAADQTTQLQIAAPGLAQKTKIGDSIAVNGCCLTVASGRGDELTFDLLQETMSRTNLKRLQCGHVVNLERALRAGQPFGGHFVQGHIDCVSPIIAFEKQGADFRLEIALPAKLAHYIALKGSIAVDGISLTVAGVSPKTIVLWIIPHTKKRTNLDNAQPGDLVNLEFDILAKYVERMVAKQ